MSDGDGLGRREYLAGLVAATVGAAGGATTHALLTDRERTPLELRAVDALVLDVSCESGACATAEDVGVEFVGLRPGEAAEAVLRLDVRGTRAGVWLRCPGGVTDELARTLEVSLAHGADGSTPVTVDGTPVEGWPLSGVLSAFDGGRRLAAVTPDTSHRLRVTCSIPESASVETTATGEVPFRFAAVQHRPGTDPKNPWGDR